MARLAAGGRSLALPPRVTSSAWSSNVEQAMIVTRFQRMRPAARREESARRHTLYVRLSGRAAFTYRNSGVGCQIEWGTWDVDFGEPQVDNVTVAVTIYGRECHQSQSASRCCCTSSGGS